ncbi:MAG TPA: FAD/NAD(P)-binding oxidoreductase [Solirubrobacterales bacterium]|nr:FAD/NAD(P)-binding oxidoreductase [Solirubrobacterales bacterium]
MEVIEMKAKVVIVGGGVAALEAALILHDVAGERAAVEIYSARGDFVYRPYAVGKPFGNAVLKTYDLPALALRCGAEFHPDNIVSVDASAHLATTFHGRPVPYDYLLFAAGASRQWPISGATTFWGIADVTEVEEIIRRFKDRQIRRAAFTMPSVGGWSLPMYELALLTEAELSRAGLEDYKLTVVTPEDGPLQLFGRNVSEAVATLLEERGIELIPGTHPVDFHGGRLRVAPEASLDFDEVISLPRLEGRDIDGLIHDSDGFVRIDDHCRALHRERIYAAGDTTSFPVKQGGIASQQADVAAEAIAAELGVPIEPSAFDPILRAVLWTGYEPLYLQGWLGGGHGETSTLSTEPPWKGSTDKIVARRLTSFLADVDADHDIGART